MSTKSLKDYLKKYESNSTDEKKKKKRKKTKPEAKGVLVVDEDPVWQKPVNLEEEEEDDDLVEEKPVVDEDIEVKRMKRLEQLRAKRAYNAIAEDGSGWISLSPKHGKTDNINSDISPPRRQRVRNDTPSPEPSLRSSAPDQEDLDLSPPRQRKHGDSSGFDSDLSPARKGNNRNDTPSPEHRPLVKRNDDLSPPRRRRYHSSSPELENKPPQKFNSDFSPPWKKQPLGLNDDLSPPRKRRGRHDSPESGMSPSRKSKEVPQRPCGNADEALNVDISPRRKPRKESSSAASMKEQRKTGLISGQDIREEILKTKKDELSRFKGMDPILSGKGAEPVFRDKIKGERISKEEYLKSKQKLQEKPKEVKLEWGKGLAQKREAEARLQELELEKNKPFARTRDDPDLDKMLKERVRWGDPMAHLVKRKQSDPVLSDLGENERMKESGFIIPQEIPSHSWIKRGLDAAPNRYGIRPGRHWDGVDRSNGYEKQLFQRTNEKRAVEREAYLWAVSDM